MSKTQIKRLVRTCTPEELVEHIWFQEVRYMEFVEWVQSNYPGIKLPDEFKRKRKTDAQ